MSLKTITASAFLLVFLSSCSTSGKDSKENSSQSSQTNENPTRISIGPETAKSHFLFEVKSSTSPDKEFIIYSDDFTKRQSFNLCPNVQHYSCDSHIQVRHLSVFGNKVEVDFFIRYFDSEKDSPYEGGPDKLTHFPVVRQIQLIDVGKRTLADKNRTNKQWLKSVYVTYNKG